MTILKNKLVQSKVLQDYLVDKTTGEALTAGVITLYKDESRTELKNWYYQNGQFPNYSYLPLQNPMTLSAAGTIVDVNGSDVLPMFYPWSEADDSQSEFYYITVVNAQGQMQFTRSRFPWVPTSENPPTSEVSQLKNLIINNRFWRAAGAQNANGWFTNDLTSATNRVVAPDQHDGFSMPDIRFLKDVAGSTDICTFKKFLPGEEPFTNAIRPEFYLNHLCSTTGGGETFKRYQIPISLHIATLDGVSASFSIFIKANNSTSSNTITPKILQFTGSSSSNTTPVSISLFPGGIAPTTEWAPYTAQFTFPTTTGKTYDANQVEDSAFYLQIDLVPKNPIDVDIAIPSTYLGDTIPTTDFINYDQIDSIINSSRTGQQLETWSDPGIGWIPSNNGSIGSTNSSASIKGGVNWPLFNILWTNTTQSVCPVSSGIRGASAISDWESNYYLGLPNTLGRSIAGLNGGVTNQAYTSTGFVLTMPGGTTGYTVGSPVQVVGTSLGSLVANTVYYATNITPTSIDVALTVELAFFGSATPAGIGSGTIRNALGVLQGKSTTSDVPNHVHPFTADQPYYEAINSGDKFDVNGSSSFVIASPSGTTGNNTGGVAFINLYQPTTSINFYLKL